MCCLQSSSLASAPASVRGALTSARLAFLASRWASRGSSDRAAPAALGRRRGDPSAPPPLEAASPLAPRALGRGGGGLGRVRGDSSAVRRRGSQAAPEAAPPGSPLGPLGEVVGLALVLLLPLLAPAA